MILVPTPRRTSNRAGGPGFLAPGFLLATPSHPSRTVASVPRSLPVTVAGAAPDLHRLPSTHQRWSGSYHALLAKVNRLLAAWSSVVSVGRRWGGGATDDGRPTTDDDQSAGVGVDPLRCYSHARDARWRRGRRRALPARMSAAP